MKTAFLFPGQGAQTTGMGADIAQAYPVAAELYDRANEILGYDIKNLCFNGPEEKLAETTISQPAIFVTSAAILEVIRTQASEPVIPDITAGLSLGEYTALYAAGAISFEEALTLVQERGDAMQAAADATSGSMVSVIGMEREKVAELCRDASHGELLTPANFNCPGQIVISGSLRACARAVELAEKYGAIKAIQLKVAGAFHTEMMASAAERLQRALEDCTITVNPDCAVLANVDAIRYKDADQIRKGLVRQLVEPILWQDCMETLLADGVEKYYEIGPGRVLIGLMKRINRKTRVINVSSLGALNELVVPEYA